MEFGLEYITCHRWSCEACDNMESKVKERKESPKDSAEPDGMPTGLVVALLLLLLGGLAWLGCCLWAICTRLKTRSTDISDGKKSRSEGNRFPKSSKRSQKTKNQEGPDYENAGEYENIRQNSSGYDEMYGN